MIAKQSDARTMFVEIHPNDGTRYEFLIQDYNEENLWIAGSLMTGYIFRKESIRKAAGAVKDPHMAQEDFVKGSYPHYVGYVAGHNKIKQNDGAKLWIARAMILAGAYALDYWDAEDEEMFRDLSNR